MNFLSIKISTDLILFPVLKISFANSYPDIASLREKLLGGPALVHQPAHTYRSV